MKVGIFMCEPCLNNYKKVVDVVEKEKELKQFKQKLLCIHHRNKYICKKKLTPPPKDETSFNVINNKVCFFQPPEN